MHIKNLAVMALATCFALTACNKYVVETDKRIETTLSRVEEYREMSEIPDMPETNDTVRMQNDIWLGSQSVKIMEGEALPAWLEKDDGITVSMAEDTTLAEILQEVSDMTGMNIRLDDLKAEDAVPEDPIAIKYSGNLSGLLNYISSRYGIYWQYKGGIISFFTQETRVFTIYALPTETSMSASLNGSSMGENAGGGSASSSLSTNTNLALWDNIEEGVKQVVGENGKLAFSRVAGTITVTASPYVVRKVAEYVDSWNEKLSRQVAITVRVLQVTLSNKDDYGLNLKAMFNSSNIGGSFTMGGVAGESGALAMTILKNSSKFSGSNALIQAFSTQGKTRLLTSASVTTLNNKVAPIQITTTQNYVREYNVTTSGSGDDKTTDTDMETDTLNYGFSMDVLPRILNHGRLILLFHLSITDLISLDQFSSSGGSEEAKGDDDDSSDEGDSERQIVQLPKMQTRAFMQEVAMRSGSTLILTGFESLNEQTTTSGVGKAKMGLLGGQAYNNTDRTVMVLLMTPEILQSPLSQEALMRDY